MGISDNKALHSISPLKDRVSNADLFLLYGIVVRIEDSRIPNQLKQLLYSQRNGGKRNGGHSWLYYKDKLKANFVALQIDNKHFELNAHDRDAWKSICQQRIKQFSVVCIHKLKETRIKTKANANLPATLYLNPHTCVHSGLVWKYLAGVKCHLCLSKCWLKQQWTKIIVRISCVEIDGKVHYYSRLHTVQEWLR